MIKLVASYNLALVVVQNYRDHSQMKSPFVIESLIKLADIESAAYQA